MDKLTTFTEAVNEPLEVSLAEATLTRLRNWFTVQGLRPSTAMWEGIEDLCVCLQRMAEGKAKREFFLSSLDPGVGKTQTIFHFLLSLLASPKHEMLARWSSCLPRRRSRPSSLKRRRLVCRRTL